MMKKLFCIHKYKAITKNLDVYNGVVCFDVECVKCKKRKTIFIT